MSKSLRLIVSIIGLVAVILYMLHFFYLIHHPAIPWVAGITVIAVYLFGVYARKYDSKE